ncbi:zonadhesin-like isoform X2 [Mizuhopecten yessoensis]|uniref:zonadhesin-like isoform X2 n=1 Tax=Mizuhopecten yessoensis TaxID=6573 RepID=UPI000B45D2E4|nr:zonadhesin-like isoform X2 [Mizuhopecten yessoensis]
MDPTSTTQSAFSECFKSFRETAGLLFSSCVYDYCAFRVDNAEGKTLEKVLCDDVSDLSYLCAMGGITVKWRTSTLCPLPCGPNSHYSADMSACPATCVDREAPSKCTGNAVEGCECDTGYVLSNQRCVRVAECGCTDDDGQYYPLGTKFVSKDCSVVRQCTAVGNEMKIVVKETRDPCGTNAECKLQDGQYTCVCKARHKGDPLKGCTEITCGTNAHYVKKVTACPASCQDPTAPSSCQKPMAEGCACDKGFVRNDGQCIRVQECGCKDDDGTQYQDGAEFISSDCSVVRQCTAVGNEMKIVVKETRETCGTNAECKLEGGQDTCVCKARHTGDPLKACTVPETCGKFPKCHPSAVCVDNDHCECKAPNQGDGIKGCYPVCWCQASGDPHYIMFDGQRVNFMGTCKYTLSQYQKVGDTCSYAVEVKNEHRSGYTHVSYTRLVDIRVFDTTIRLHLQKRVYVNGKLVFLPYRTAQFEIALSGTYVRLETRCGLVVQFDGASSAIVQVPNVYGNDLTGICGNCNNNPNDDQKDYSRYEVVDDSDLQLQQVDNTEGKTLEKVLCDDVSDLSYLCAMGGITVKWRTSTLCPLPCGPNSHYSADMSACPATCVDREAPSKCTGNAVEGCECDTGYVLSNQRCVRVAECGCTDDDGQYYPLGTKFVSKDCSVVRQCTAVGNEMKIVVKETRDPCGTNAECKLQDGQYTCVCKARHKGDPLKGCTEITCGTNAHYVKKVTACPASCQDPTAPSSCQKPMAEGCACDKGFVRNDGQCIRVQECGCKDDDGTQYQDGAEFISSDCSVVRQCTAVGNEMKIVVKETREPCGTNAECKLEGGQYTCVCKARHTGDPLKACTAPRECRKKLEGADYQGEVSQTVTGKTCRTWNTMKARRYAILGAHNGCRNPNSEQKAPWCFVKTGNDWEYCDIPMCDGKKPGCIATTTVSCSSQNGNSKRCKKEGVRRVTWIDQVDDPKCVFGLTYGREKDEVWVNGGCGGTFKICYMPERNSYKPIPTPNTECKKTRKGTEYKGTWGITASGRLCQSWSSQYPQANKFYKKLSRQANYCRNPNPVARKRPWCFVDDPKSKTKWEYCDILYC